MPGQKFGILLVLLCLITGLRSYSQDIIKEKTLSVIDTSDSKINQAREIYNWITSNITYDVNSYLKGSSSNTSAEETLKRKKGICYDYALLFKQMCASINIESYLVAGYSKGAEFYKGSQFYRADHCWNAVNIDSSWFLVDATWGSGYLEKVPDFFDFLKFKMLNIPYVNKKLTFVKLPSDKYFNPPMDSIRQTHMPLDPVWQLKEKPYSMQSFESDSTNQTILFVQYKDRLRMEKNYSENQQIFEEGLNGKEFNNKNNFNIAAGYLTKAGEFDYTTTKVDSFSVKVFREILEYFKRAQEFISFYKASMDSTFSSRSSTIKEYIKKGTGLRNKLYLDYKSDKKNFKKKQESISNRYKNLLHRVDQYDAKMNSLGGDTIYEFYKIRKSNPDTATLNNNERNLAASLKKFENLKSEIDSSVTAFYSMLLTDSVMEIKYKILDEKFSDKMKSFYHPLDDEDNLLIASAWDTIYRAFISSREQLKIKNQKITVIQGQYSKLILSISLFVSRCQNQTELINTNYKYTGDSLKAMSLYKRTKETLLEVNGTGKEITFQFRDLNGKIYRFNDSNFRVKSEIAKPSKIYLQQFVKYEEELLARQKLFYKNERQIAKNIVDQSNKGSQAINKKLGKFYLQDGK